MKTQNQVTLFFYDIDSSKESKVQVTMMLNLDDPDFDKEIYRLFGNNPNVQLAGYYIPMVLPEGHPLKKTKAYK